ncbi:hypothetical protein VHEMI03596 [[Torrubiella] hemipterigena]|uniref:Prp 4 CRoW domain-containing protein n=1 Tax=[Torrubiella] hemipterigena TaxID=1531966 RepID=A0A0A1TBA0_9HYPO|nr:hypothetical protein VHEMI03596 [[Torrubiella] hemipterigena]
MHFTTATAAAVLAFAANAVAEPQPYMLAAMPGLSLMRRDSAGYTPETSVCGAGNTCAEACGSDFTQCASTDGVSHCFNPKAKQACCTDGSGNSCDEGYYCTHDTALKTWCCPNGMDLAACAAAYTIKGGLKTGPLSTSTPAPSSTPAATVTDVKNLTTTYCPESASTGHSTAWTPSNSTVTTAVPTMPAVVPSKPAVVTAGSGAAATGVSALVLVAAGFVALL